MKRAAAALVVERLAHGAHAARERILVDVASVPELLEQFGARNQPVAIRDQMQQYLERPVGEVDQLAVAPAQPARRRFDLEFADQERFDTWRGKPATGAGPEGPVRALIPVFFSFCVRFPGLTGDRIPVQAYAGLLRPTSNRGVTWPTIS